MEALEMFIRELFNYNPFWATIFLSMLPGTEARLAIPFGMNTALWGTSALNAKQALLCGFLGSSLIVPILALTFKPLLNFAKRIKFINKFCVSLENRLNKEANDLSNNGQLIYQKNKRSSNFKLVFGVFLFVLLPMPLTGVYAGSMIGVFLNIGFVNTCLAVILGNFFACLLMTSVSSIINTTYVILAVFISLFIMLIVGRIKKRVK